MANQIDKSRAKDIWIHAQKLDEQNPFGRGSEAVFKAVRHLGYVQIDTISVIERCHHHILYNRIPDYHCQDLHAAQSKDKSVFEYWTHALSYVPTEDFRYFIPRMKRTRTEEGSWFSSVTTADYRKVNRLLKEGPISIRDIKDDELVEKEHPWGSSKPSKKALQLGFYKGDFVISEREGMLKKYELANRHFGWEKKPKAATEIECAHYILERATRSQGIITVDSVCHLEKKATKDLIGKLIQKKVKLGELVEVSIDGTSKVQFYAKPETLEQELEASELTHILSPFDPLIIQRKRLKMLFDYEHLFEAYIAKEKRKFGYFTLPVLHGSEIIAMLDLKTDRVGRKLLIQNWVWRGKNKSRDGKKRIEAELDRFERFQLS